MKIIRQLQGCQKKTMYCQIWNSEGNLMKKQLICLLAFALISCTTNELPKVLIIGDSISIGYTPFVEKALKGKAKVMHNEGNAEHTGTGLLKLDEWLGDTEWDIIHFNWGLWDLCYRSEQSTVYGNRDKINGTITFSPEQYGKNLEQLVIRLKQTGAKLIFATTTYVPAGEAGRFVGDDRRYNEVATRIMKAHDIEINELNSLSRKIHNLHKTADGDVHYTPEGYELLSRQVTAVILENLH